MKDKYKSIFDNITDEEFEEMLQAHGIEYEKVEKGQGGLFIGGKKVTIKELENIKSYDYKKNLENLKERYLNKISWLEKHINEKNQDNYIGIIDGISIAIHDIEYMLSELEV